MTNVACQAAFIIRYSMFINRYSHFGLLHLAKHLLKNKSKNFIDEAGLLSFIHQTFAFVAYFCIGDQERIDRVFGRNIFRPDDTGYGDFFRFAIDYHFPRTADDKIAALIHIRNDGRDFASQAAAPRGLGVVIESVIKLALQAKERHKGLALFPAGRRKTMIARLCIGAVRLTFGTGGFHDEHGNNVSHFLPSFIGKQGRDKPLLGMQLLREQSRAEKNGA